MDYCHLFLLLGYTKFRYSPVFVCKAGPVGSHSELAQELAEPLLDLDALLSAFVPAGSLSSSSEAVAVVNPGVVEAGHPAVSSVGAAATVKQS